MAASRILWKPLTGGVTWASMGVGASLVLPTVLSAPGIGLVYATPIIATSLWGGALLVLLPVGVSRGIISSVQDICHVQGRPALQQALDGLRIQSPEQLLKSSVGTNQLLERLTLGSGWQGDKTSG